jgi:hypothetical protein
VTAGGKYHGGESEHEDRLGPRLLEDEEDARRRQEKRGRD